MSNIKELTTSSFTTGKFAQICNTTKNTLFHYDEIGLLKPSITKENGYRYYSVNQIQTFEIINVLKECNCSLKEIKEALENTNIHSFLKFIEDKKAELLLQRNRIDKALHLINNSTHITSHALDGDINRVYISNRENDTPIIITKCSASHSLNDHETATILNTHFASCNNIDTVARFPLGYIILKSTFNCGELNHAYLYSSLNKPLDQNSEYYPRQFIIEKGTYLNIKHKGTYETIGNAYQTIFNYIYTNNITLKSDIYEENLISYLATSTEEDHIIHIFTKI